MSFEQLVQELRKLNHADKLRAMQVLVVELASEEDVLLSTGANFEIITPYGNEVAAAVLYEVLQASADSATDRL